MDKKKQNYLFYFFLFVIFVYLRWSCNNWNDRLTGENGKVTTAHVYAWSRNDNNWQANYIYKVGDAYYTEESSSIPNSLQDVDLEKEPIHCFPVAYDQTKPSIHMVLWKNKHSDIMPLGSIIEGLENKNEIISNYMLGWHGVNQKADINNQSEISKYKEVAPHQ